MKKVDGIIEVPGMGQNLTDTVLQDVKNFTGEYMTDIVILVDESISVKWRGLEADMKFGLENIKQDLLPSKNVNSIRVCVIRFGATVPKDLKDLEFVPVEKMDTSYHSYQRGTHLYEAICVANNLLMQHIATAEEKQIYVNGLVIVATDGRDEGSEQMYPDAKESVFNLGEREVDFQYICVGPDAIETARGLGLEDRQILDVNDTSDGKGIRERWGQASASARSASQRAAGSSVRGVASTAAKFNIDDD